MSGIYIHIPFCRKACHYCDFHFSTNLSTKTKVVDAIIKELEIRKNYLSKKVQTIYFGGGTPSVLTEQELQKILDAVSLNYSVENPEITLEANPEDLSREKLNMLMRLGINRLSIGVQSFNEEYLKLFNRNHSSLKSVEAVNNARMEGFDNISLDLIFGSPNQTVPMVQQELNQLLSLDPEHISIYGLTIESGTVFGHWEQNGQLKEINEDTAASQFELIIDQLTRSGFEHYEVSNFSKPGFKSKHNSSYWAETSYLGVGPGAHSYNGDSREFNVKNNPKYIQSIDSGIVPSQTEHLTREDKINEAILTSIRTSSGLNTKKMLLKFDHNLMLAKGKEIEQLIDSGHLLQIDDNIVLTKKGIIVADGIIERLVL